MEWKVYAVLDDFAEKIADEYFPSLSKAIDYAKSLDDLPPDFHIFIVKSETQTVSPEELDMLRSDPEIPERLFLQDAVTTHGIINNP